MFMQVFYSLPSIVVLSTMQLVQIALENIFLAGNLKHSLLIQTFVDDMKLNVI